jgi:hypothetical protein
MLDDVFRLQRTLLACAQGQPADVAWLGPCRPLVFLGLIRTLLILLASLDVAGTTVLAEHVLDDDCKFPRLRRGRCRPWVLLSNGERVRLLIAVVTMLRDPGGHARPHAADAFQQLWPAMSPDQRDTLRRHARRWPPVIRHRIATAAACQPE